MEQTKLSLKITKAQKLCAVESFLPSWIFNALSPLPSHKENKFVKIFPHNCCKINIGQSNDTVEVFPEKGKQNFKEKLFYWRLSELKPTRNQWGRPKCKVDLGGRCNYSDKKEGSQN